MSDAPPPMGASLTERIADAVAAALGGSTERLQTERDARIVRLPDGRAPVLVRDFGHAVGVCVDDVSADGGIARMCRTDPIDALVREVAASAETWSRSKRTEGRLTLFALVPKITSLLSDAFGEPWTASFPGVQVPEEVWFHGADFDAAAVGIVRGRVSITLGDEFIVLPVATSREWLTARDRIVEGVRAQQRSYERFVAQSEHLDTLAAELRSRLEVHLGRDVALRRLMRPTHSSGSTCRLESKRTILAKLEIVDGAVVLAVGAPGEAGWRRTVRDLDSVWPEVLAAVERADSLLDLRSLKRGSRYRVLEPIQAFSPGALLTFVGFVDIDNHYGSYDFEDPTGGKVSVTGDFSTPERHPFAATYRYLELVPNA